MVSIETRAKAANDVLKAVSRVTEKIQTIFPEALQYYEFFARNTCVGFPCASSSSGITFQNKGPLFPRMYNPQSAPFFLIPLYEEDSTLGHEWAQICNISAHAAYIQQLHGCIMYQKYQDTETVLGVSILHELYHAVRATQENRAWQYPAQDQSKSEATLDEEGDAYSFQGRIVKALNPNAYNEIIEHHIRYMEERIPVSQRAVNCPIIPLPLFSSQMDVLYGAAESQQQSYARHNDFIIMSYLTAFKRWLSEEDRVRAWRTFLLAIYARNL